MFDLFPSLLVVPDSWIEPFCEGLSNNVSDFFLWILSLVRASNLTGGFKKGEAQVFRGVFLYSDLFGLGNVSVALAKATERFGSAGPRFTRRRGRRRYRHRRSRLSGAPRTPVVVPQGTMPEPGNGVTSPARRNRTRSINRPSPVTSLERTGIVPVT
jgi:hypothetical protein